MYPETHDITDLNTKEELTNKAVALMKLLAHPVRLSILCNLMHADEMSAGDIVRAEEHRASQSQVSQYLAKLRQDNVVTTRRDGQTIYYRVQGHEVQEIIKTLHNLCVEQAPGVLGEIAPRYKIDEDD